MCASGCRRLDLIRFNGNVIPTLLLLNGNVLNDSMGMTFCGRGFLLYLRRFVRWRPQHADHHRAAVVSA